MTMEKDKVLMLGVLSRNKKCRGRNGVHICNHISRAVQVTNSM
jgi:hypothetical protein